MKVLSMPLSLSKIKAAALNEASSINVKKLQYQRLAGKELQLHNQVCSQRFEAFFQ